MWRFVLVVVISSLAKAKAEAELEDGVLVLNSQNFDEELKNNPLMLVKFYAPWCGHCKKLAPEYAKAAGALAEGKSEAKLAKVDCTEHKEVCNRFNVKGYPTVLMFGNGQHEKYTGGRTSDAIVDFVNNYKAKDADKTEEPKETKAEKEIEDGVLVLTSANFDDALKANPTILVEFYAPWCGHCKKLAPEYAKAAQSLAEEKSDTKLGKVDATVHADLAKRFGVRGYPTLKFFKNGQPQDYTGGRTADTITSWIAKRTGPPAVSLDTVEAANQLAKDNKVVVLGFFKSAETESAKQYLKAAESNFDVVFGIITDESLFAKLDAVVDSVVLLKQFDEGRNVLEGEITSELITKFVNTNSVPLMIEYNEKTSSQIFSSDIKVQCMLFSSPKDEAHNGRVEVLTKLAKENKGEMMFVSVSSDVAAHKRLMEFFGVTDTPTIRIIERTNDFIKYKPDSSDMTEENLRSFITAFKEGKLERFLKSEEVPADWDAKPVKVLVGKNFEEVALDPTKDVLVKFYAPWCGHCKKLAPTWDELADLFKGVNDVVIAKMDLTVNEAAHKEAKASGFPTIKLFHKDGTVTKYEGDRSLDSLGEFVRPSTDEDEDEEGDEEGDGEEDDYDEEDYEDEEEAPEKVKDEL